ncbi:hypothetical protein [Cryobacterium sp. 10C3]|uniref:hypothetical protein n=1 Tax=Cryobacterium sp. 10C3 TaxID=3048577 RepID=UPI002AB4F36B|nr:hypothetical protein [Cryobacterium sp. 10C3]MDY7556956.1 hypothetical protein [Cryobacterium sp. 10C3]
MRPTLKVPAPRAARVSWKVLGIALVLLVLSGCAAAPVAPPSATPIPAPIPPVMTEAARQELADQAQTALRDGFVASYPDVAVPTATRERFLSLEEIPSVIAACLTAAGVPAVASPEGGIETYVALGDEERHAIADYVCNTRFPSDPKNSVPLNESQVTYLYQYQTTVLMPCLETAHIRVDPPPTLESFMANYTGQGPATVTWQPYAHIDQGPPIEASTNNAHKCPNTSGTEHPSPLASASTPSRSRPSSAARSGCPPSIPATNSNSAPAATPDRSSTMPRSTRGTKR